MGKWYLILKTIHNLLKRQLKKRRMMRSKLPKNFPFLLRHWLEELSTFGQRIVLEKPALDIGRNRMIGYYDLICDGYWLWIGNLILLASIQNLKWDFYFFQSIWEIAKSSGFHLKSLVDHVRATSKSQISYACRFKVKFNLDCMIPFFYFQLVWISLFSCSEKKKSSLDPNIVFI